MTAEPPRQPPSDVGARRDNPVGAGTDLGSTGSPRTEPPGTGPGLTDLLSELSSEVSTLFQQEVELAKAEVRAEAKRAGKAGGKLGAAAVVGLLAAFLLSWALAFLIDLLWPTWVAFAIVGIVYAIVAAVLGMNGKKQLQRVDPTPQRTVETLKEDKQWVQNR